jgi:hypothetical protein
MVTDKNIDDFDAKLDELLRLPRFSPSAGFSDRVMSQVAVFQQRAPVKVAARSPEIRRAVPVAVKPEWAVPPAIARWIPESRPARYAAGALAAVTSFATTAAALVVVGNLGLASFVGGLAVDRMIGGIGSWGAGFVNGALGQNALDLISTGGPAQSALVIGGLAAGGIAALAGLRKAASLNPRTI